MVRSILKNLGMDEKEISIYLVCLAAQQIGISDIAKKTGIKRTTLYPFLERLIKKGYIHTFHQGGSGNQKEGYKRYTSTDIEVLVQRLKEKGAIMYDSARKLENISASLCKMKINLDKVAKLEFYEWPEGIKSIIDCEFTGCKEVCEIASGGHHSNYDILKKWLTKLDEGGIKLKVLKSNIDKDQVKEDLQYYKKHHSNVEIRYINDDDYSPLISTVIMDKKVIFVSHHKNEALGIMIKSQKIADNQMSVFKYLWKGARVL